MLQLERPMHHNYWGHILCSPCSTAGEACMAHKRASIAKIKVKIKIKTVKRYKETFLKQKETHQGKADLWLPKREGEQEKE